MKEKQSFAVQSLAVVLVLNVLLLLALYLLLGDALQITDQTQWFTVLGVALVGTLVLWFVVQFLGRRAIDSAVASVPTPVAKAAARPIAPPVSAPVAAKAAVVPAKPPEPAQPNEAAAVQMLAILQRQGRLIDFLQEDLSLYDDSQIGAAVRGIHEGCKQALTEHVTLEPIFKEDEGSRVTVSAGFDANAIRLTGTVVGQPPFKGDLRHRGWRIASITLPKLTAKQIPTQAKGMVVAAAEVEVGG